MSDIFFKIITSTARTAKAIFKSLTDVVLALQQKVGLKATIQKISPHNFGQTSMSFSGNYLEKNILSRFNKLLLLLL